MEEVKKKQAISLPEVKDILEKEDPEKLDQIQRWTYDYVTKFAKTDADVNWEKQDQFTGAVEQILNVNDPDDLRGTFKKVNSMRNNSGELTPQTLYYYPRTGGD